MAVTDIVERHLSGFCYKNLSQKVDIYRCICSNRASLGFMHMFRLFRLGQCSNLIIWVGDCSSVSLGAVDWIWGGGGGGEQH